MPQFSRATCVFTWIVIQILPPWLFPSESLSLTREWGLFIGVGSVFFLALLGERDNQLRSLDLQIRFTRVSGARRMHALYARVDRVTEPENRTQMVNY